jgi:hypothetical protein
MAGIDPSIPLQGRGPQLFNPLEVYGQVQAIRQSEARNRLAEQDMELQRQAQALQSRRFDVEERGKEEKLRRERMEFDQKSLKGFTQSVLAAPPERRQEAYLNGIQHLLRNGVQDAQGLPPQFDEGVIADLDVYLTDPQQYMTAQQNRVANERAVKQDERAAKQDQRAQAEFDARLPGVQADSKLKGLTAEGRAPIQPAQAATIEAQRAQAQAQEAYRQQQLKLQQRGQDIQLRGQNMSDSRAREMATITRETKPPTEAERKNAGFYSRALEASKNLDVLEKDMASKGLFGQAWMDYAPNFAQSEGNQSQIQAQRAFTEARLRRDSGAAIPPQEFENDKKMYFPQPGDTPKVLEQKRKAREKALAGMLTGAGRAMRELHTAEATVENESNQRRGIPSKGTVEDGYVFMGGNPGDPKNWKKQ